MIQNLQSGKENYQQKFRRKEDATRQALASKTPQTAGLFPAKQEEERFIPSGTDMIYVRKP